VEVRLADALWAKTGEVTGGKGKGKGPRCWCWRHWKEMEKKTRLAGKMWLR
jgi:hypothetical protein